MAMPPDSRFHSPLLSGDNSSRPRIEAPPGSRASSASQPMASSEEFVPSFPTIATRGQVGLSTPGGGGKVRSSSRLGRKRATPYDRPPTGRYSAGGGASSSLSVPGRGGAAGRESLATRLVGSASRLLTSSASYLFSSIFGKPSHLPLPLRLAGEPNANEGKEEEENRDKNALAVVEEMAVECGDAQTVESERPKNDLGLSDIEEILKRKTLSREQFNRIAEILKGQVVESSDKQLSIRGNETKVPEDTLGGSQLLLSTTKSETQRWREERNRARAEKENSLLELSLNGRAPTIGVKFLDGGSTTPVEVARAYMGERRSEAPSPADLGLEEKYQTPAPNTETRRRTMSAAWTPYSRSPMPSSSMRTKRSSSILEDGSVGTVGPSRRTRQRLSTGTSNVSSLWHAANARPGTPSSATIRLATRGIRTLDRPTAFEERSARRLQSNEVEGKDLSRGGLVPLQSSETAKKILETLEKMSPSPKGKIVDLKAEMPNEQTQKSSFWAGDTRMEPPLPSSSSKNVMETPKKPLELPCNESANGDKTSITGLKNQKSVVELGSNAAANARTFVPSIEKSKGFRMSAALEDVNSDDDGPSKVIPTSVSPPSNSFTPFTTAFASETSGDKTAKYGGSATSPFPLMKLSPEQAQANVELKSNSSSDIAKGLSSSTGLTPSFTTAKSNSENTLPAAVLPLASLPPLPSSSSSSPSSSSLAKAATPTSPSFFNIAFDQTKTATTTKLPSTPSFDLGNSGPPPSTLSASSNSSLFGSSTLLFGASGSCASSSSTSTVVTPSTMSASPSTITFSNSGASTSSSSVTASSSFSAPSFNFSSNTTFPTFGTPSNPDFGNSSCTAPLFGGSSSAVTGSSSTPVLGNSSSSSISLTFGNSSTPAFGSSSTLAFGSSTTPTFGSSSTLAFSTSATPTFGSSSTPAFGSSSAPTFGNSSAPAFGSSTTSALGNSTTPVLGSSSTPVFGSPSVATFGISSTPAFGSSSTPAVGSSSTSAVGSSSAPVLGSSTNPIFGSSSAPAFGSSSASLFGNSGSNPTFSSSSTPAFGTSSTPAFGSSSMPAFGSSSTAAFGSSSAPAFGSSSTPAFGSSTIPTFGSSNMPAFSNFSTPSFSSSSMFGGTSGVFGSSSSPAFGATTSQGASTESTPSKKLFSFSAGVGTTTATQQAAASNSSTSSSPSPFTFGAGSTSSPSTFSFGGAGLGSAPSGTFGFGATTPPSSGATPSPFMFGGKDSTSQPFMAPFGASAAVPEDMEDNSMAEEPAGGQGQLVGNTSAPTPPSPSPFMFGAPTASPPGQFTFGAQPNMAPGNNTFAAPSSTPNPFGGGFSLGSTGGGEKSGRRFIKAKRGPSKRGK